MKRPRLRLPSFSGREDALLVAGFFGGIALAAAAIALMYLPAGLLVAGVATSAICARLASQPKDDK